MNKYSKSNMMIIEVGIVLLSWITLPIIIPKIIDILSGYFTENVNLVFIQYMEGIVYLACFLLTILTKNYIHGFKQKMTEIEIQNFCSKTKFIVFIILVYLSLSILIVLKNDVNYEIGFLVNSLITNFIIVGISEEFAFRRIITSDLEYLLQKKHIAVLISSVLFMCVHIIVYLFEFNSLRSINLEILAIKTGYLLILGIALAIIYLIYHNIAPCILVHGCQNILAQYIYIDQLYGIVIHLLGLVIISAVSIVLYLKRRKHE